MEKFLTCSIVRHSFVFNVRHRRPKTEERRVFRDICLHWPLIIYVGIWYKIRRVFTDICLHWLFIIYADFGMEKLFSTNQFGICHRIWESDDINTQRQQQSKKEIKEERRKEEKKKPWPGHQKRWWSSPSPSWLSSCEFHDQGDEFFFKEYY